MKQIGNLLFVELPEKPKGKKPHSSIITECTKCGKPTFMFGLCYDHSAEFEREGDGLPTHNDWRLI